MNGSHDNDFCRRSAHSLSALADRLKEKWGWWWWGGGLLHAYINEHTWTELHVMRAFTQHRWNNSKVVFFLGNLAKT